MPPWKSNIKFKWLKALEISRLDRKRKVSKLWFLLLMLILKANQINMSILHSHFSKIILGHFQHTVCENEVSTSFNEIARWWLCFDSFNASELYVSPNHLVTCCWKHKKNMTRQKNTTGCKDKVTNSWYTRSESRHDTPHCLWKFLLCSYSKLLSCKFLIQKCSSKLRPVLPLITASKAHFKFICYTTVLCFDTTNRIPYWKFTISLDYTNTRQTSDVQLSRRY